MAAIGGAIAAGAVSGIFSAAGQSRANRRNREEAALDRQFQERMSSTAVRRRMDDMRKAGINPILAGRYEASSPSGRATSPQQSVGTAFADSMSKGAGTAAQVAATKSTIGLQAAQSTKLTEEAESIRVQREGTETRNLILKHGEEIASIGADIARTVRSLIGNKSPDEIAALIKQTINQASSALTNAMESASNSAQQTKSTMQQIREDIAKFVNDQIAPGRNFDPNKTESKTNMQQWRDSKSNLSFREWQRRQNINRDRR